METTPDLGIALRFLDELGQNNNKPWFDRHRAEYEQARSSFYQFVDGLIDEFCLEDCLGGLSARECTARIFRDIRFSRDKSPYKTNFAALVGPGGWKMGAFGYYLAIGPHSQSMVAGGLHEPTAEQLERFRQSICSDSHRLRQLIAQEEFIQNFGGLEGERLKTAPKGYDREHPDIDLLQLKQITVVRHVSDQEVVAPGFADKVVVACRAMRPFLDFLNEIMG